MMGGVFESTLESGHDRAQADEHLIHDRLRDGFEAFPVPGSETTTVPQRQSTHSRTSA